MKKLIAIILAITLLFSFSALPVSAELGDSDNSLTLNEAKSIFERIADVFHDLIAKMFKVFGLDCPLCENHDGYGEAEGDGDFNKEEIAKKYNEAVNGLKAHKKTLKIEKKTTLKAKVEEAPYSIKVDLEKLFKEISISDKNTLKFNNNESAKISAIVPPTGKEAKLSGAYVEVINFLNKNDDAVIEFTLNDSTCTYDGTTMTLPEGYADVINPLNLDNISDVIDIIHADIAYTDTTVEAALNNYSKVKNLKISSTITINATVKNGNTSSVVKMVLNCADEYTVTYP